MGILTAIMVNLLLLLNMLPNWCQLMSGESSVTDVLDYSSFDLNSMISRIGGIKFGSERGCTFDQFKDALDYVENRYKEIK